MLYLFSTEVVPKKCRNLGTLFYQAYEVTRLNWTLHGIHIYGILKHTEKNTKYWAIVTLLNNTLF